jgi:hypothetical protein
MPVVAGERPGSTAFALAGAARRPARWNVRAAARTLQAQARLRARRWSHVALAWDGATLQLFVNGRAAGRHAATGGLGPQIVRLRLGGDFHAGRWLRGRLDEVRIYDRALGAAEVAADMRRPLGSG